MPKFNILVTRDTTESTTVDVVADTLAEAQEEAPREVRNHAQAFDWTADDCTGGEGYIADPDAPGDCGQCEGTGTIAAGVAGQPYDEPCTVCDGTGVLPDDGECQTCADAIETRLAPCDECGHQDGED